MSHLFNALQRKRFATKEITVFITFKRKESLSQKCAFWGYLSLRLLYAVLTQNRFEFDVSIMVSTGVGDNLSSKNIIMLSNVDLVTYTIRS